MEDHISYLSPTPTIDDGLEVVRSWREVPPADYLLKVENFSLFSVSELEKVESGVFEAGGYKWKLSLYPNGNLKGDGNGHISLYLAIADRESLSVGWEVNVNFKLFVFDHVRDKFLTIQDVEGRNRRFHKMKTEWGSDQLLPLKTFTHPSNGYLYNDSCIFGAEVLVVKNSPRGACLSVIKGDTVNATDTWTIHNFSRISEEFLYSNKFLIGECDWKMKVYPKGSSYAKGECLSLYLELARNPERQVCAKFKLRIKDQVHSKHHEREVTRTFPSWGRDWGFPDFLSLKDLNDASKGFMVDNTIIVEAQIVAMVIYKNF